MRLYEIQGFGSYPTEELLLEGWIDSVKKSLGDKVDKTISVVNNTTEALQVFYKIGTDPDYLETVVFLLKKDIKQKLKNLGDGPIMTKLRSFILKLFPDGRKLMDFIKCCILASVLKFAGSIVEKFKSAAQIGKEAADGIKDQAQEIVTGLISKLANLDTLINSLTQASGVFTILKAMGVANDLLFELLTNINKKISGLKIG